MAWIMAEVLVLAKHAAAAGWTGRNSYFAKPARWSGYRRSERIPGQSGSARETAGGRSELAGGDVGQVDPGYRVTDGVGDLAAQAAGDL